MVNGTIREPQVDEISIQEFRRLGLEVIESIADRLVENDRRSGSPAAGFNEAEASDQAPDSGETFERILREWREDLLPSVASLSSSFSLSCSPGSNALITVLSGALTALTSSSVGTRGLGLAVTEVERQSLRWLAKFSGYPSAAGIMTSTGVTANYIGICTALRHHASNDTRVYGLQAPQRAGRFLLYMADHEGDASVFRIAEMLNLGSNAVRLVNSRADLTIDPAALEEMVRADKARGDQPFCVVAQLGSANAGAVDPLDEIAEVCDRQGLWLHGDGTSGFLYAGVPQTAHMFAGIERADSVSFDGHTWLDISHDCAAVLVRDDAELRAFSISGHYSCALPDDRQSSNFFECATQTSRAFRGFNVWMMLRRHGVGGLRNLLTNSIHLTQYLHALVQDHPDFEVLHAPRLPAYSFRYVPHSLAARADDTSIKQWLDELNERIAEDMQSRGYTLFTAAKFRRRTVLRTSDCFRRRHERDVDAAFEALVASASRLQSFFADKFRSGQDIASQRRSFNSFEESI